MSLVFALTAPAFAENLYDGVWDVTVETRAGSCEATAHYRLTVQDGKVSGPADIAGTVAHEGVVKVSLNGAYANGQLAGKTGSGRWNAASAGKPCSGHWEATKE
jgi:predicted nucleic acid-binding Zn ribbon protein